MANLINYRENNAAMLMVEAHQRASIIGSKTTTTTRRSGGGASPAREPSSSLIHINTAHFQQHSPLALHQHNLQTHQQPHQHYAEENNADELLRKSSTTTLSRVHEEAAVNTSITGTTTTTTTTSSSEGSDDVRKCGYLRKQKHGHKRFFVLREPSQLGPSRLEYYDSEKKFRNCTRSASCPPKRVIPLYQCFTVNRRADAKNKYLIALYTKDECFAMVAENEHEQESWYLAISDLMNEGKKGGLDSDELDDGYGTVTPGTVFKEVWQVNVKPKGLGHTKNLTGVYRLCLSSKTIHLVKLNSDTPCVNLQLMNIRRCGHSESFFFIEVGRSASIGPGEIWMQVDDSVVAQNMHETILETMKALKAFAEFRPRSKSQSSGSNPIAFITTRRHLGNLPPSQTGLQRRARTESMAGTPPTSKSGGYRFRTSSEGEGTMARPFRSVTGSLIHLNTARINLGKQEGSGRYVKAPPGSAYHTRSASLPVSHFPSTTSPVSVSSSSGHGSVSDTLTRPSSASICGSPSDGGFNSSDEYGSSPGDFRYFRVRSNTPDSLGNTPPIREENCLSEYMSMDKHTNGMSSCCYSSQDDGLRDEYIDAEKCFRKRTHSLTKSGAVTVYQKMAQTTSSLDEPGADANPLGSHGHLSYSASPKSSYPYPEDYCEAKLPSPSITQRQGATKDDGYMPMMPGVAQSCQADYMPMHPKNTAPKQIVHPRAAPHVDSRGYMMMQPSVSCSPVQNCSKGSSDRLLNGEYMDMSQSNSTRCKLSSDCYYGQTAPDLPKSYSSYFSLPRSYKAPAQENGKHNEYVPMCSPGKPVNAGPEYSSRCTGSSSITSTNRGHSSYTPASLSLQNGNGEVCGSNRRAVRPTRLSLGSRSSNTVPQTSERALPPEPHSPGEYINIDFGEKAIHTPYCLSAEGSPPSLGSNSDHRRSPLNDYMSLDLDAQSPKAADVSLACSATRMAPTSSSIVDALRSQPSNDYARMALGDTPVTGGAGRTDDYTEMTFNLALTPPRSGAPQEPDSLEAVSPSSIVKRLCIVERYPGQSSFPIPPPPSSAPPFEPKVIRADPQGRRRHSSETFSSSPSSSASIAPASALLTDSSKRHSSASFDSVWLRLEEGPDTSAGGECSSQDGSGKMCRNTSAGYQNGLNYIALDLREDLRSCEPPVPPTSPSPPPPAENRAYASIDFSKSDRMKGAPKGWLCFCLPLRQKHKAQEINCFHE